MTRCVCAILMVGMICLGGCEKPVPPADEQAMDTMVAEILVAISEGKAGEMYATHFSPDFQARESLEQWQTRAKDLQALLGKPEGTPDREEQEVTRLSDSTEGMFVYGVRWERGRGKVMVNATWYDDHWLIGLFSVLPDHETLPDHTPTSLPTE